MRFICSIVFVCIAFIATAQKQYTYNDQVWLSYFNQTRLSKHWGLWLDGSIRTRNQLVHEFSQGIIRIGATWIVDDHWRFTGGYAYMHHFANSSHPLSDRPEHRPFEMVQWQKQFGNWRVVQTARLEQRFRRRIKDGDLTDGYNFNHRARYGVVINRALSNHPFEAKTFALQVGAELFGNFGKEILNNHFDQLRLNAGLNYQVSRQTSLMIGYLYQLQQFTNGNGYNKLNGLRVTISQQVDRRQKS